MRNNPAFAEYTDKINYGCPMGSCTRGTFYPERQLRRQAGARTGDPLVDKRLFACGEAARRGWMVMVWDNPYMRRLVRERLQAARLADPLPLPG